MKFYQRWLLHRALPAVVVASIHLLAEAVLEVVTVETIDPMMEVAVEGHLSPQQVVAVVAELFF